MILSFKENSLFLKAHVENKLVSYIAQKINIQNAAKYFQVVNTFNQAKLEKLILSYIERCFTMICKTNGFLEIDFPYLSKILASSELLITSELQVYNSARDWIGFDHKERCKFSKDLLLKVRMPLLPDGIFMTLQKTFHKTPLLSPFVKTEDWLSVINEILNNKGKYYQGKSSIYYTNRYNSQDMFYFLFLGGQELTSNKVKEASVKQINGKDFKSVEHFTELSRSIQCLYDAAYVNGELYEFGSNHNNLNLMVVEKYSAETKTWSAVGDINHIHNNFMRLCVFMDKIFVVGGLDDESDTVTSEIFALDTNKSKWIRCDELARMKMGRANIACAVFQGRLVASGGFSGGRYDRQILNSVEAYDDASNSWSGMPNMIAPRQHHDLVAMKNKLFVIGGEIKTCEVFDTCSNKFIDIKLPPKRFKFDLTNTAPDTAVSLGSKIIIFGINSETVAFYDVDKDEWDEEPFELTTGVREYTLLKVPKISYNF